MLGGIVESLRFVFSSIDSFSGDWLRLHSHGLAICRGLQMSTRLKMFHHLLSADFMLAQTLEFQFLALLGQTDAPLAFVRLRDASAQPYYILSGLVVLEL